MESGRCSCCSYNRSPISQQELYRVTRVSGTIRARSCTYVFSFWAALAYNTRLSHRCPHGSRSCPCRAKALLLVQKNKSATLRWRPVGVKLLEQGQDLLFLFRAHETCRAELLNLDSPRNGLLPSLGSQALSRPGMPRLSGSRLGPASGRSRPKSFWTSSPLAALHGFAVDGTGTKHLNAPRPAKPRASWVSSARASSPHPEGMEGSKDLME